MQTYNMANFNTKSSEQPFSGIFDNILNTAQDVVISTVQQVAAPLVQEYIPDPIAEIFAPPVTVPVQAVSVPVQEPYTAPIVETQDQFSIPISEPIQTSQPIQERIDLPIVDSSLVDISKKINDFNFSTFYKKNRDYIKYGGGALAIAILLYLLLGKKKKGKGKKK